MILKDFRKQIEDIINQSGLSIDAVYFVLKDIFNEVTQIYENVAKEEELQAALKEQEDKEKEDTNDKDINKENDAEEPVE